MNNNAQDITGQRFGLLVAFRRTDQSTRLGRRWYCLCDCGGRKVATPAALNCGSVRSCGCLHSIIARAHRADVLQRKMQGYARMYGWNTKEQIHRAGTGEGRTGDIASIDINAAPQPLELRRNRPVSPELPSEFPVDSFMKYGEVK